MMEKGKQEALQERERAKNIIDIIRNGGMIQLFASDGSGVIPLNPMLSDFQMEYLEEKLMIMMQDLIDDIDREVETDESGAD